MPAGAVRGRAAQRAGSGAAQRAASGATQRVDSTARGLRRVPENRPSEERREPERRRRRRKKHYKLISLGEGLDMPLLVFIMVLLAIGLVMLFSASYAESYYREDNSYFYIVRQGEFALFGVFAMLFISTIDYHYYHRGRTTLWVAVGTVLLLVLTLLIGSSEGEATRWLELGPVRLQPSEVAKFAIILLFADFVSRWEKEMDTFRRGVMPFALVLVLFAGLVMAEHHLSGTLIIGLLGFMMMFVGGTKFRWLAMGALGAALVVYLYMNRGGEGSEAYQMGRIEVWLNPFEENDATWQTRQSLYAIGSGGLFGVWLGQSRQKYMYLPKPQNDFIFAIVCEELGLVGALVIMILFALLVWRGVHISLNAKDTFGKMLGLGLTFQIGLQAALNICVVTNTVPNTGISLPFFSYGGTALLMLLGEMGILLNISRSANVEKT